MRTTVMGIDWFYTIQGQGEPVLFLHGGLDACANYDTLLSELADGFRVIAVDRRGHGQTADTDAPFDYALMAEELAAFARALELPPCNIIGYSDGANLGLHMASRFPDEVKSLIAMSALTTVAVLHGSACAGYFTLRDCARQMLPPTAFPTTTPIQRPRKSVAWMFA